MITIESQEFRNLILKSAELRAKYRFADAIDLIEKYVPNMDIDCLLNAYIEIIYAAEEGGFNDKISSYVRKLKAIEPGLPTLKKYMTKSEE